MLQRSERATTPLLIAFVDLAGFAMQAARVTDDDLAAVIDGWYERVAARVASSGGRTVKFIGDAALLVWPAAEADAGTAALLALKEDADAYFGEAGWECRAQIKAHVGECVAGGFGAADDKRFDVIGKAVNTAAMLDSNGVALSPEAFRALSPETRQRFKKHTWPVTYIRVEDPHRFRRR
ncbi:MAG TPA: adenylate/guanylate cyclase domain-containing protein [Kofleriaceae bacterium]|nr:adenylate/guanylate cyclase domain-containing protein [Kofleriaceae bacterium]